MPKNEVNRSIARVHTEDEMRQALQHFRDGKQTMSVPQDIFDDDVVLSDAITELISKRSIIEDVRNFMMTMQQKLSKR